MSSNVGLNEEEKVKKRKEIELMMQELRQRREEINRFKSKILMVIIILTVMPFRCTGFPA